MNSQTGYTSTQLILYIAKFATDRSHCLNKTTLIKYVYLMDVAYYRRHRRTLSNYPWRFYKFGPWSESFNQDLERLKESDKLWGYTKNEENFTEEVIQLKKNLEAESDQPPPEISALLKQTIAPHLGGILADLLNFVYFETEPMMGARRDENLDFNKIEPIEEMPAYSCKHSKSSKTKNRTRREQLQQKYEEIRKRKKNYFNADKLDDTYWKDVAQTD